MTPGLISRRRLIESGLLAAAGCAASRRMLCAGAGSNGGDESAEKKSWTIANEAIARTVTFAPDAGLTTEKWSDLETGVEFVQPGVDRRGRPVEFSFECNGRRCVGSGGDFALLGADEAGFAKGRSLTVRLRHGTLPLEVAVVYRIYEGHAAVRKHLVLKNSGAEALRISHLAIEAVALALGPANEMTLLTQYGAVPREIFYTGRSEDAGLLVANGRSGAGMAVVSEVPGWMKRTEIGGWDDAERTHIAVLYDTDLMPFERTLGGGEEFTTAAASLVAFRNGDGLRDPRWRLPAYAAQVLERKVDEQGPPWIYNTWEPFTRGINREITMELIDAASAMGMDVFTIDDGWQQEYGENGVNLTAFPGGLKPIEDALAARKMRLGLWIPVAAIGTSTEVYRSHPEWAATDQDGSAKTTGTAAGTKAVMCMASAYRDAAAARIIDAIERFNLAYVKLDLTTVFNAYGEAPGCWAKGHYHHSWAESLGMIYEGMAAMTAAIYRKHPEVLLDLTFELWGQKHVIDAGLLAAGDLDWMSNVDDNRPDSAGPRQARQLLYQRAATMPAEAMLIGNLHAELPTIEESFATAIGSAPLLLGDLRKLSAADRAWYGEKIAWFKKLRRSTRISESFFALGSWQQTTPEEWDGFARLEKSGRGIVALFRNKSGAESATVRLPLMPKGRLSARSVMTKREIGMFTASDWARGVDVPFPGSEHVEVLELSRAGE
jgi:alpha-galactosidase